MKHSPAPWQINKYQDCIYADDKIICERQRSDLGKETFEANMKVIAAAPELLDVLKEAKEVLIQLDHRHNGKCYNPTEADCKCTLCKIERVLKKASS